MVWDREADDLEGLLGGVSLAHSLELGVCELRRGETRLFGERKELWGDRALERDTLALPVDLRHTTHSDAQTNMYACTRDPKA